MLDAVVGMVDQDRILAQVKGGKLSKNALNFAYVGIICGAQFTAAIVC